MKTKLLSQIYIYVECSGTCKENLDVDVVERSFRKGPMHFISEILTSPYLSLPTQETVANSEAFFLADSTGPGGRFSKAPESFRARKAIFRSLVSKTEKRICLKRLGNCSSSLEYVNKTAL